MCPEMGTSDLLVDCSTGKYCPEGSSVGVSCPKGTYNNEYNRKNASECKACDPGSYCAAAGLTAATGPCKAGHFCMAGAQEETPPTVVGVSSYGKCPTGHYCPAGTAWPLPCPVGTFRSEDSGTSLSSCQACTAGYYCSLSGQSNATA